MLQTEGQKVAEDILACICLHLTSLHLVSRSGGQVLRDHAPAVPQSYGLYIQPHWSPITNKLHNTLYRLCSVALPHLRLAAAQNE